MANNPNPDFISEIMENDFGTRVLITNTQSDIYLKEHSKQKRYNIPDDRYSRPCGGSGGFDDFVERWHE